MIIKDKLYINTVELGHKVSNLCELFTYKNPEIFNKKRLKLSIANVPASLYHYRLEHSGTNKILQLPRGGLQRVIDFYKSISVPFRVVDQRVEHPTIDVELIDTVIEDQQKSIIALLLKHEGGLIEASPGAGKTVAMLGIISAVKQPTLILVHEHRLSTQWMSEIKKRLKGNFKLGKYDGEIKEDGDIVVGIINSVYNLYQEDPNFFDKFGMVIADECHHVPATMFLSVLNNISSKYRIGISGTIKRRDSKEILTYDIFGETLIKIKAHEIKHRITNFNYKAIDTGVRMLIPSRYRWTGKKRENVLDITECLTKLAENKDRNALIVAEAAWCIDNGYFPLILSSRVSHNEFLHKSLTDLGYNVVLLIGKTRKRTNWIDIQQDPTIQCIVANDKIASEGLDLPTLSAVLITCPTTNTGKLEQQIGRIRRTCEGKPVPIVIDFVDNLAVTDDGAYLLQRMAMKRIRFYEELKNKYTEYVL